MPPKQSTATGFRGRPAGSKNKATTAAASREGASAGKPSAKAKGKQRAVQAESSPERQHRGSDAMEVEDEDDDQNEAADQEVDISDDEEPEKTIPPDLLTRILHEFFEKDGTRITKDANNTVARYMDVFVKEAIARAAAEREGGFLEVCLVLPVELGLSGPGRGVSRNFKTADDRHYDTGRGS